MRLDFKGPGRNWPLAGKLSRRQRPDTQRLQGNSRDRADKGRTRQAELLKVEETCAIEELRVDTSNFFTVCQW